MQCRRGRVRQWRGDRARAVRGSRAVWGRELHRQEDQRRLGQGVSGPALRRPRRDLLEVRRVQAGRDVLRLGQCDCAGSSVRERWRGVNVTRHRSFDVSFRRNETQERIVRWESAIRLDPIPAGATFLEKWSNGHYSDPEVATTELLARDDSGIPTRHCERRVLIDLSEGDGQSPPLSRGDVIRDEILYRIRTAMALGDRKSV